MTRFARCALLIIGVGLAACSGNRVAPVADRTVTPQPNRDERVVVAGDTLYSIAWEAGHDYKEVARWNRIGPPYLLQPGQTIRLSAPSARDRSAEVAAAPTPPTVKTAKPKSSAKPRAPKSKPATTAVVPRVPTAPAKPTTAKPTMAARAPTSDVGPWVWPSAGKVMNASNKGIDIVGERAQAVRAAAPGRVVYAGSGLRGYGQLIILKHSEDFLSAYAHNDKIYVKEGDVIKRGQQIAEMGSSGAERVKLHFEIRRGGVPVDPLQFLPKY